LGAFSARLFHGGRSSHPWRKDQGIVDEGHHLLGGVASVACSDSSLSPQPIDSCESFHPEALMKFRVVKSSANMIGTYQADASAINGCLARILVDLLTRPEVIQYPCVLRVDGMERIHVYKVPEDATLEDLNSLPKDEDDVCGIVLSMEELKRYVLARLA
jgi:hypothetical protein